MEPKSPLTSKFKCSALTSLFGSAYPNGDAHPRMGPEFPEHGESFSFRSSGCLQITMGPISQISWPSNETFHTPSKQKN